MSRALKGTLIFTAVEIVTLAAWLILDQQGHKVAAVIVLGAGLFVMEYTVCGYAAACVEAHKKQVTLLAHYLWTDKPPWYTPPTPRISKLNCSCGWEQDIPESSAYHFTIYEYLPKCPNRRWWNGILHRMRKTLGAWS